MKGSSRQIAAIEHCKNRDTRSLMHRSTNLHRAKHFYTEMGLKSSMTQCRFDSYAS